MERGEVIIDRMLVVVFDTEGKAYEGRQALLRLENEGSIGVYASAVVAKDANGSVTVKQTDKAAPVGPLIGSLLGSMIGLLGGPMGVTVGAMVGLAGGSAAELNNARIGADFIDDVSEELKPNKFALVAEIRGGLDYTGGHGHGGDRRNCVTARIVRCDGKDPDAEVAAMKADIAQMKAERRKVRADRKEKLLEKINQLHSKIKAGLEKAKQQRQAIDRREKAKVEVLKAKAAAANNLAED